MVTTEEKQQQARGKGQDGAEMFLQYFMKRILSIELKKWLEIFALWIFIFLFGTALYSLLCYLLFNFVEFQISLLVYAIITLLLVASWYLGIEYRSYLISKETIRNSISKRYIKGKGIEIGALHNPLRVYGRTKVTYVDRMGVQDLRKHYPELIEMPLVEADIIDDGEILAKIADGTQDFVIANHFLEHCQNPILAMENMLRVLKKGGVIYLAIPNKEVTFDSDRPVTSLDHLLRDYNDGPEWSQKEHYNEWVRLVGKVSNMGEADLHCNRLMSNDYSIHFHVWDSPAIQELINFCQEKMNFIIELCIFDKNEFLFLLIKDH